MYIKREIIHLNTQGNTHVIIHNRTPAKTNKQVLQTSCRSCLAMRRMLRELFCEMFWAWASVQPVPKS